MNNLATSYSNQGRLIEAEALYKQCLAKRKIVLGESHPHTLSTMNNLASTYKDQGRHSEAEVLYKQCLDKQKEVLGESNPDTLRTMHSLALVCFNQGRYGEAETSSLRSLAIIQARFGENHPLTVKCLNAIASIYAIQGFVHKAETTYMRVNSILEKTRRTDDIDAAMAYTNFAILQHDQGHNGKAELFYEQAIAISKKKLGLEHIDTANRLTSLGLHYGSIGKFDHQLALMEKGISAQNHWLTREVPLQSQKNRSAILKNIGNAWLITFDIARLYPQAAELALRTRLNRQGILQEIEQRQSVLLRAPGPQQELANQLGALNTQLASVSINSSQRQEIRTQRDQLEAQLYRSMPDLQLKEVSHAQISAILPADSVLVEFQRYQPYNGKKPKDQRWGSPQYLALILKPNGSIKAVPLGPAKPIEAAIAKALASTQEALADSQTNWEPVRRLVLDPLQPQLKGSRHWFLSPDAELTRIPFLALPATAPGQHLLSDDVKISVLTTGRDLLRLQKPTGASEKAAVIVNPSYALGGASSSVAKSDLSDEVAQRRSAELGSKTWQPLPQTQTEGEEIAQLLSVPLISKDQATTNLLQSIHGPKVLHVATHGYFQPNQETTPPDLLRTIGSDHQLLSSIKTEDPMLRSGLVLAGADNPTANPADDGYLTAAEATGLQLDGTELVVLSACSTGQGVSKTGEGVYGLQRALTVAGARSTLLSLWKVDDDATRAFMVRYYTLLKEGKGRGEALVQVQREFRTDPAYKAKNWDRPYYWAAWQLTGDWKPIQGL
jgi:CHAT domain-containing protein/Tfp pilus assembly protein PilF